MKKLHLLIAFLALPVLFFACGSGEAPVEDTTEPVEETEIEVVIVNGLGSWDIAEIWIDSSDGAWTESRIDEPLAPGAEFSLILDEAGDYDIEVIDEDGDSYSLWIVEIDEDGYEWEVTLEDMDWGDGGEDVTVTIENGLGSWTLWYGYCSPSDNDDWGDDRFGSELLAPGESISFEVMSGDYYDFKCIDEDDDEYYLWDVWVDDEGFVWEVDLSYMDNSLVEAGSDGDAAITFYNGLGDWTIWYVYGDPSDGPWGEDRLGSELLEPGEEFTFYVPAGDTYDFKVEDGDGDTYTLWGIDVDENGFYWEVELSDMDQVESWFHKNRGQSAPCFCINERNPVGKTLAVIVLLLVSVSCFDPAKVIITNDLEDKNIEYIYVSSGSEDEWGINSLPEWKVLLPGETHEITVLPDTYDLQVMDENGDTYTLWDITIEEDNFLWDVVAVDID